MAAAAAHAVLRQATADKHAEVDAAFAQFDLGDRQSYARFLSAHARALSVIERTLLAAPPGFPPFRTRLGFLASDLDALGMDWPNPLPPIGQFTPAEQVGVLYVAEGSRLGGGILAGRVGRGLPTRYLRAVHDKGEWRNTLQAIDTAALGQPEPWLGEVIKGARRTFELYALGAKTVRNAAAA